MIYLLEDDESIRKLVTYTLQHAGYEAAGLSCPSAFWAAMKRQTPELVLLDIMLPVMDGWSVLRTIRQDYGSAESYLEAEYGLTPARLMRLRRMYLE